MTQWKEICNGNEQNFVARVGDIFITVYRYNPGAETSWFLYCPAVDEAGGTQLKGARTPSEAQAAALVFVANKLRIMLSAFRELGVKI